MKRLLFLFLALAVTLSLCACQGNFGSVNLKDPITLPEDGIIDKNTVAQIKNENAIAVFVDTSGDFKYEWTIFGSDIASPKEINLGVQISKTAEGDIRVALTQTEAFGFSALLSIHLEEQWDAPSATAYVGDDGFAAVSITGSKTTILNLTLDGSEKEFVIRADPPLPDNMPTTAPSVPDTTTEPATDPGETTPPTEATAAPTEPEHPTQPAVPSEPEETVKPTEPEPPTEPATEAPTEPPAPTETGGKDKYNTDPIPQGKPDPVEPEDQDVNKGTAYSCIFSIECSTILNNLDQLEPGKLELVPSNGVILEKITVTFYEGESVFDVLQRVCRENGIHLEASWTPMYNSAYIEGIHNLYEFDCGSLSGWMYRVNGWYPNYGCSRYHLKDGDVVEWRFTCDMGNDIGGGYAAGG